FSSRRRHTRFSRDWSSDVCSSDLSSWLDLGSAFERHQLTPLLAVSTYRRVSPSHPPATWTRVERGNSARCAGSRASVQRRYRRQIGRASCRERVEVSVVAVLCDRT